MIRRKGSLNLSINAIVVLILAITMLGLGLGFMKKMFGATTDQFTDVADQMKEQLMDDLKGSSERLALNKVDMNVKKGTDKEIYFAIRNDEVTTSSLDVCSCITPVTVDTVSGPVQACDKDGSSTTTNDRVYGTDCTGKTSSPSCLAMGSPTYCKWGPAPPSLTNKVFYIGMKCYNAIGSASVAMTAPPTFVTLPSKTVEADGIAVLKAVATVPSTAILTTYTCKLAVCNDGNAPVIAMTTGVATCGASGTPYEDKDFYINVVSG